VESLIVVGDLSTAADTLEGGLHGSEAEEIATEWVKQARKRAVAEQTLRLLHACASSITFSDFDSFFLLIFCYLGFAGFNSVR
jgi:MICOS complex subunit MIC60